MKHILLTILASLLMVSQCLGWGVMMIGGGVPVIGGGGCETTPTYNYTTTSTDFDTGQNTTEFYGGGVSEVVADISVCSVSFLVSRSGNPTAGTRYLTVRVWTVDANDDLDTIVQTADTTYDMLDITDVPGTPEWKNFEFTPSVTVSTGDAITLELSGTVDGKYIRLNRDTTADGDFGSWQWGSDKTDNVANANQATSIKVFLDE